MQYSGILITAPADRLEQVATAADGLEGVEVHYVYPDSGRAIAVLETETRKQQQERLKTVQNLEGVTWAELVYHQIEDTTRDLSTNHVGSEGGVPKRLKTVG